VIYLLFVFSITHDDSDEFERIRRRRQQTIQQFDVNVTDQRPQNPRYEMLN